MDVEETENQDKTQESSNSSSKSEVISNEDEENGRNTEKTVINLSQAIDIDDSELKSIEEALNNIDITQELDLEYNVESNLEGLFN